MTRQEAYKILGITEYASTEQIKKAYKTLAKKYHPDIYRGDKKFAEEKMKQINEAYTLLSTTSTHKSSTSSEDYSRYYETGQRAYNDFMRRQKEEEERIRQQAEERRRKIFEDIERLQKEIGERQRQIEERQRKMKKMFKPILILLFIMLEYYIVLIFKTAIQSISTCFNEAIWFLFGYWIILGIIALAGIILAPIGFIWLMKKAEIFKK